MHRQVSTLKSALYRAAVLAAPFAVMALALTSALVYTPDWNSTGS
ncbi:hypothetical protein [Streptomyces roseirectus]|nr:hypothetical protein [Streptomyces roseirectus]